MNSHLFTNLQQIDIDKKIASDFFINIFDVVPWKVIVLEEGTQILRLDKFSAVLVVGKAVNNIPRHIFNLLYSYSV